MQSARARQHPRQLDLFFDGGCSGNPGPGTWGAVLMRGQVEVWRGAGRLCEGSTNNTAEYMGLINGLRGAARILKDKPCTLTVFGDSELVIKQMKGEYSVRSETLQVLHRMAAGERTKLNGQVEFVHILRNSNTVADELARQAMGTGGYPKGTYVPFYPNLCGLWTVDVEGVRVRCSNDVGTALNANYSLIDAAFLASLPSFRDGRPITLVDTFPVHICTAKGPAMDVLGMLPQTCDLQFLVAPTFSQDFVPGQFIHYPRDVPLLVVRDLPVPLHLTYRTPNRRWQTNTPLATMSSASMISLTASAFPESYRNHPHWSTNAHFIPYI